MALASRLPRTNPTFGWPRFADLGVGLVVSYRPAPAAYAAWWSPRPPGTLVRTLRADSKPRPFVPAGNPYRQQPQVKPGASAGSSRSPVRTRQVSRLPPNALNGGEPPQRRHGCAVLRR